MQGLQIGGTSRGFVKQMSETAHCRINRWKRMALTALMARTAPMREPEPAWAPASGLALGAVAASWPPPRLAMPPAAVKA